jgi:hypothetical protein
MEEEVEAGPSLILEYRLGGQGYRQHDRSPKHQLMDLFLRYRFRLPFILVGFGFRSNINSIRPCYGEVTYYLL